jgi:hypothetical protein
MNVIAKYYDTNGHNFGIEKEAPDRNSVEKVYVQLPNREKEELKAIAAYKNLNRPTIRSPKIDQWLRKNSRVGQSFSAKLSVSDDGREHFYYSFNPIWE